MDKVNNFIENLKQVDLTKIDWGALLDWEYITDPNPKKQFIYEQWIYVIVLLHILLSVVCFAFISKKLFQNKPKYRFIRKVSFLWFANTIFLLLYNLLRSEGVSLLSMRLFLVLILVSYIGIFIYSIVYWLKFLPKRMKKYSEAKLRDKYARKKK